MTNLYVTADRIDPSTGGGLVAYHQSEAFKTLGMPCHVWGRDLLQTVDSELAGSNLSEPWGWDRRASEKLRFVLGRGCKLAHFYSGTFSDTVRYLLHEPGCKVVYSLDPHDKEVSRREHEKLGLPFPYEHLVRPELWRRYIAGYGDADVIICSSSVGVGVVRSYGPGFAGKRIVVIPHGCVVPDAIQPEPDRFVAGYLGSPGPDKGLVYLIKAWGMLKYRDATLVIAGRDSTSPFVRELYRAYGGGNVVFAGYQKDIHAFYNSLSLYVQPSATEGFGLEVLEALAHGRPVVCSQGAGASDVVAKTMRVPACDAEALAGAIDYARCGWVPDQEQCRRVAEAHTWDKIRQRYVELWRDLLT